MYLSIAIDVPTSGTPRSRDSRVVGHWPATGRSTWRQEHELGVLGENLSAENNTSAEGRARLDVEVGRDLKRWTKTGVAIELRDVETWSTEQEPLPDRGDVSNLTGDWRHEV